ncbi:tail fiber assembly protein [Rahnella bonaserana]
MSNFAIVESAVVVNIVIWDGVAEWSPNPGQTAVEVKDGNEVGIGYSFIDGKFVAPVQPAPTQEELTAEAKKQKAQILQTINETTQMWQTQLLLGIITDDDKANLTSWMKYAQQVQAVDTSKSPVIWPETP